MKNNLCAKRRLQVPADTTYTVTEVPETTASTQAVISSRKKKFDHFVIPAAKPYTRLPQTKQKKMNKGTILVMFYAYQEMRETIRFLFIRY